jgi:spermidine synthase
VGPRTRRAQAGTNAGAEPARAAPAPPSAPLALAAALFLISGVGALVVETTWLRWLRLLLGASAPAVSATLVAFFTGQALGAALAGRVAGRARRPLAWYGALEWVAAAACLAVPLLLGLAEELLDPAYDALRTTPARLAAARYAAALLATLPAALCFGASLPLLAAASIGAPEALGRGGALLYGVNTAGAALGVALASFVLPEWIGITAGNALGAALLALAGGGALLASRVRPARVAALAMGARSRPPAAALRALAALSGLASFAAQVLLVQAFARVLNQSTYAFGAVLIVTLLALAAGALAVAALERSGRVPAASVLGWSLVGAALAFAAFPAVFVGATDGLAYLGAEHPWPAYLWGAFGLAAATAGPGLLAAAGVLPALLALAGRRRGDTDQPGALAGALLAWNTAGAIAGALLAPYLLLPLLGLWLSLAAIGLLYAVAAVLLVPSAPGDSRLLRDVALGLGWMLVISRGSPLAQPPLRVEPGARLLAAEQSAAGLVAVLERDGARWIQIDNHYALGGSADAVHQERQGHLPLLLHPAPRRVAFLGSATGSSAGAALAHDGIGKIALVEIVPGVAAAARGFFALENRGVYDDPRSEVALDDARNYLRATADRFDVIVADLFVPWQGGTGSLYSREHFAAARARLAPGGVFCQWLPLYQLSAEEVAIVSATFLDEFPDAFALRGDFFARHPILALVGGAGPAPDPGVVAARAAQLRAAGVSDRWVIHPLGLFSLYLAPLAPSGETFRATPRNRDDRPRIELLAARTHAGRGGKLAPLTGLDYAGLAKSLRETADAAGALAGLPEAARRAGDGGHALQAAGALHAAGRDAEAGQALATAAALLPADLFAEAAPDPTAADAWHGTQP